MMMRWRRVRDHVSLAKVRYVHGTISEGFNQPNVQGLTGGIGNLSNCREVSPTTSAVSVGGMTESGSGKKEVLACGE